MSQATKLTRVEEEGLRNLNVRQKKRLTHRQHNRFADILSFSHVVSKPHTHTHTRKQEIEDFSVFSKQRQFLHFHFRKMASASQSNSSIPISLALEWYKIRDTLKDEPIVVHGHPMRK